MAKPIEIILKLLGGSATKADLDSATKATERLGEAAKKADAAFQNVGKAASTSFNRMAGLASDPLKFFADAEKAAAGFSKPGGLASAATAAATAATAKEIKAVGVAINEVGAAQKALSLLPTIDRALGLGGVRQIGADVSLLRGAMAAVGVAGGALIAGVGAIAALAIAANNDVQDAAAADKEASSASANKLLERASKSIQSGEDAGSLKNPEELKQNLDALSKAQVQLDNIGQGKPMNWAQLADKHVPEGVNRFFRDILKPGEEGSSGQAEAAKEAQAEIQKAVSALIKEINNSAKESFATEQEVTKSSAQDKLALVEAAAEKEKGIVNISLQETLKDKEYSYAQQIQATKEATDKLIEIDAKVWAEKRRLLQLEADQIEELLKRESIKNDPEAVAKLNARRNSIDNQKNVLGNQAAASANQIGATGQAIVKGLEDKDPPFVKQWKINIQQLQEAYSALGKNAANALTNTIQTGIEATTGALTRAIVQTGKWGDALKEIGIAIETEIISSIIRMALQWVTSQILMHTVGQSLAVAGLAEMAPIAAGASAIWSAPAALAAIATYGGAAAAAPAEVAAAVLATTGLSVFHAATGGQVPGSGTGDTQPAMLTPGEYVSTVHAVQSIGPEFFKEINRSGRVDTSLANPGSVTGGGGGQAAPVVHIGIYGLEDRMLAAMKGKEGQKIAVDIAKGQAYQVNGKA